MDDKIYDVVLNTERATHSSNLLLALMNYNPGGYFYEGQNHFDVVLNTERATHSSTLRLALMNYNPGGGDRFY